MSKELLEQILSEKGVGSQLWSILSRLGVKHRDDCSCLLLADVMNSLGSHGCKANRQPLLKLMRMNQEKYGWKDYLRAGANAVIMGWVFKLNPLDPLPGLLDEAIRLAEEQEQ